MENYHITRYKAVSIDGREAARADATCSASGLLYPLEHGVLMRRPMLSWEWRIDDDLEIPDHRSRAGDDFAARVYVIFEFQPERASPWERLRHRALRAIFGVELPGRALNYVWSLREEPGEVWDNPFTEHAKMISRGAGPRAKWRSEEVDVAADYRRVFGEAPSRAIALALMTDTDNSCQEAVAYFANVALRAHPRSVPGRSLR